MVATASTTVPIAHTIYTIPTTIELFFARFHFTVARYMALKTSARKKAAGYHVKLQFQG